MNRLMLSIVWLLPVVLIGLLSSADVPQTQTVGDHSLLADPTYEGANRCRTCHRKEDTGGQFGIWEASAHASAFATLGTDAAKEIASEKGLGDPQTETECLQCHVTAYDVAEDLLGSKFDKTQGVSCESCHGAGGDYYKKKTMISITKGEIERESVGLIKPDEQVCLQCHNDRSPSFKEFDFEERLAKIAHPIPDAKRAEHTGG